MKLLLTAALLTLGLTFGLRAADKEKPDAKAPALRAADALVSDKVHVTVTVTAEHRDPKNSPEEVVDKKLDILLTNHTADAFKEVSLRVILYARDLDKDKVVVEKTLNLKATLPPRKDAKLVTDAVTFNFTPQHGVASKGRRGKVTSKRVPATGHQYAGYAVQVLHEGKIIGENYSAAQFKPAQ